MSGGPHKKNWNGYLGPRIRQKYNTAKNAVEHQMDPYGTGQWITFRADPGTNYTEDWISPYKNAGLTLMVADHSWLFTAVGTGDVDGANIVRGGVRITTPAFNDTLQLDMGGVATVFPFTLDLEPHAIVGFTTNNNHVDYYWEVGFIDTAGTSRLMVTYEQSAYYIRTDNGTATDNVQIISGTPDTAHHDIGFRFSNGGLTCEILIDGVIAYTAISGTLPKYPGVTTQMGFHVYQANNRGAGGAFTSDWQHFRFASPWHA
jgi:hypothetical protein